MFLKAILQRRVQAVWKHRQEKMEKNKQKNKSGIWSLLSCGGGNIISELNPSFYLRHTSSGSRVPSARTV